MSTYANIATMVAAGLLLIVTLVGAVMQKTDPYDPPPEEDTYIPPPAA